MFYKMTKTPYIIITVLMFIALVVYGVWIYSTSRSRTGFFAPYKPTPGKGLVQPLESLNLNNRPLTDSEIKRKNNLINAALKQAGLKI